MAGKRSGRTPKQKPTWKKEKTPKPEYEVIHNGGEVERGLVELSQLAPGLRARLRQLRAEQTELTQRLRDCEQEYQRVATLAAVVEPFAAFQQGVHTADGAVREVIKTVDALLNPTKK